MDDTGGTPKAAAGAAAEMPPACSLPPAAAAVEASAVEEGSDQRSSGRSSKGMGSERSCIRRGSNLLAEGSNLLDRVSQRAAEAAEVTTAAMAVMDLGL